MTSSPQRLSSKLTPWYKRLFPVLSIGVPLAWTIAFFWGVRSDHVPGSRVAEMVGLGVAAFAFGSGMLLMQKFSFDPVDEVWMEEDALIVRNKGREERIPMLQISQMTPSRLLNPRRLTISLREPCSFGEKVIFILPGKREQPILEEFVHRLNRAYQVPPSAPSEPEPPASA